MFKFRSWSPFALWAFAVFGIVATHMAWRTPPTSSPLRPLAAHAPSAALDLPEPPPSPTQLFTLAKMYRAHRIEVQTALYEEDGSPGVYVFFSGPADVLRLWQLPESPEYADCWLGVVLWRWCPDQRSDAAVLARWGECGARIGPYLLFGDPQWVARSRQLISAG